MFGLRVKLLPQRIAANAWRTFFTDDPYFDMERFSRPKTYYWYAKFPDKRARNFEEMPTVDEPNFDPYKLHEIFPNWFKKYGFVMKHPVGEGKYHVHSFHFEDFWQVYLADLRSGQIPERLSHYLIKDYRERNKDLYNYIGLGPGHDESVPHIRKLISNSLKMETDAELLEIVDDLVEVIRDRVGDEAEIELLPWLFRWAFENVAFKFLNRRIGALSTTACEEADKMVEAAGITNEMIALTTLDPFTDYEERYRKLEEAQNYFYSVLKKYMEEAASQPDTQCPVNNMLQENPKDAITAILDGFQGALQTVPLTVLMALYNVARYKDVQLQAREELIEILPTKDTKINYDDFHDYHSLTRRILLETLRFTPPIIGNGRITKADLVLGGYEVPQGTNAIFHYQVACRLPDFYDQPLIFHPDRFRYNDVNVERVFGDSSRICIGRTFAKRTMFLVLAKLLRNFEFSYEGEEVKMINRLHNEPEKPLFMRVKPIPY